MGLTIHYTIKLPRQTSEKAVIAKLEQLRQRCLDLPFKEVSPKLIDMTNAQVKASYEKRDDPHRWFGIQASGQYVNWHYDNCGNVVPGYPKGKSRVGTYSRGVMPLRVVGFSTWPGEGCEEANVGLCIYPETIEVAADTSCRSFALPEGHKVATLKTKLNGWRWGSFCKTQYANSPDCGGLPNFLQCHLTVIAMLDAAKELGFKVEVSDEGDFWEKRDVKALAAEIGNWDKMIAGLFGAMKDAVAASGTGLVVESAMSGRKDFEKLEAAAAGDPKAAQTAAALAKMFASAKTPTA